ncbi:methylglyoxal synthase [Eubacterium multiforme]|uniref:Methylglyoxal synthase n=1 Tax=Eubacterium multiforme TaxID=83339 RepID=A0ABT9UW33_9FIRM|nr:methylglyoxal synthase [Eubacterium multiforme]MDQ0150522.1 methylglyoxal synthase [Eubacterium multiforme]
MKVTIKKKKNIALIAHDNKKKELIEWAKEHMEILKEHNLCGTGTTAKLIAKETGLKVHPYKSGPIGGDQQIGAAIINGEVDFMIFFWDPLTAMPHDPDVKALFRIGVLYDIPVAMNRATSDFLLKSSLIDKEYVRTTMEDDVTF